VKEPQFAGKGGKLTRREGLRKIELGLGGYLQERGGFGWDKIGGCYHFRNHCTEKRRNENSCTTAITNERT